MTQGNVEILRAVSDASAQGDPAAWLRAMGPGVLLYPRSEEPGVREVYEGWEGVMGDQVLVVFRERGRMEQSGIEVEEKFSHSYKLREGCIVEWRHHNSYDEALEAVGPPG